MATVWSAFVDAVTTLLNLVRVAWLPVAALGCVGAVVAVILRRTVDPVDGTEAPTLHGWRFWARQRPTWRLRLTERRLRRRRDHLDTRQRTQLTATREVLRDRGVTLRSVDS